MKFGSALSSLQDTLKTMQKENKRNTADWPTGVCVIYVSCVRTVPVGVLEFLPLQLLSYTCHI